MAVTCFYSGRMGNIIFHAGQMIAHAYKYGFEYFVPDEAIAYRHFRNGNTKVPFELKSTGKKPLIVHPYHEPNYKSGNPYYHEVPKVDNVCFYGYWQSFFYLDGCRDHIIETFNFPYEFEKEITGIHVRRGDCLNAPHHFPIAPREYYQNAVKYMQEKGFNRFRVYSDDIEWCKKEFIKENYPDTEIEFKEDGDEMENYCSLSSCENQITARSTFSLTAAWFNQNPDKIVCCPTTRYPYWTSVNIDLIPDYFTQIDFEDLNNTIKKPPRHAEVHV